LISKIIFSDCVFYSNIYGKLLLKNDTKIIKEIIATIIYKNTKIANLVLKGEFSGELGSAVIIISFKFFINYCLFIFEE
jgi:hypothetical protein